MKIDWIGLPLESCPSKWQDRDMPCLAHEFMLPLLLGERI
jgi:hypothetical protein